MIKIEFSLAIGLYLILTVCIIFVVWLIFEKKKVFKPFSSQKRFFWQCSICTYVYVDTKHSIISLCPRCGSYNKKDENEVTMSPNENLRFRTGQAQSHQVTG